MAPTTSEPETRIDVAEGHHIHEAVGTSRSRGRALGVVSAVALLLALGVYVHPSCRLHLNKALIPREWPCELPLAAA